MLLLKRSISSSISSPLQSILVEKNKDIIELCKTLERPEILTGKRKLANERRFLRDLEQHPFFVKDDAPRFTLKAFFNDLDESNSGLKVSFDDILESRSRILKSFQLPNLPTESEHSPLTLQFELFGESNVKNAIEKIEAKYGRESMSKVPAIEIMKELNASIQPRFELKGELKSLLSKPFTAKSARILVETLNSTNDVHLQYKWTLILLQVCSKMKQFPPIDICLSVISKFIHSDDTKCLYDNLWALVTVIQAQQKLHSKTVFKIYSSLFAILIRNVQLTKNDASRLPIRLFLDSYRLASLRSKGRLPALPTKNCLELVQALPLDNFTSLSILRRLTGDEPVIASEQCISSILQLTKTFKSTSQAMSEWHDQVKTNFGLESKSNFNATKRKFANFMDDYGKEKCTLQQLIDSFTKLADKEMRQLALDGMLQFALTGASFTRNQAESLIQALDKLHSTPKEDYQIQSTLSSIGINLMISELVSFMMRQDYLLGKSLPFVLEHLNSLSHPSPNLVTLLCSDLRRYSKTLKERSPLKTFIEQFITQYSSRSPNDSYLNSNIEQETLVETVQFNAAVLTPWSKEEILYLIQNLIPPISQKIYEKAMDK